MNYCYFLISTAPLLSLRSFRGRTSVPVTAAAAPASRWTSWACRSTAPTSAPNPSTATPSTPCGTSTFSSPCTLKRCASCALLLWRTTVPRLLLRERYLWKPSNQVGKPAFFFSVLLELESWLLAHHCVILFQVTDTSSWGLNTTNLWKCQACSSIAEGRRSVRQGATFPHPWCV